jgi:gamma-glutamyltranspeptidase/glutathione hydrolase
MRAGYQMPQLIAKSAALATGHPLGAAAGLEILRDGGNAIDAAVATTLALCVVIPGSVGLGGYGGSAVICVGDNSKRDAVGQQQVFAIDFDSCAPLAFREGMVTADPQSNYYGARAVTVPAVVAGLDLILREFGSKGWTEISQPAIRLAEEGFAFDAEHQRHFARCKLKFDSQSIASLFPDGVPQVGGSWRQPDLARVLRQLCDEGPAVFYQGEIADRIVSFVSSRDGILAKEDFQRFKALRVEPIAARCRDCELFTPPPPSGGITSLGIIQTVEKLVGDARGWDARGLHAFGEASKICWGERQERLGDPSFVDVRLDEMVSDRAAESRAARIRSGETSSGPASADASRHTSNVVAADARGNMISLTATQGWMYGSHLVVDGLGLVLNHGMSRFDYSPGHPNSPAAGKRMQHNMAPMIALRDGRPAYAYGLPGGPKIVSVTAQAALDTIVFRASPQSAIAAPRLHTQGSEPLLVSTQISDDVVAELEKMGHTVRREADMGGPVGVLAIDQQAGQIDAAAGEELGAVAGI